MRRRDFLRAVTIGGLAWNPGVRAVSKPTSLAGQREKTTGKKICILPGQWRPEFPFEQIAWIRTPWSHPLFPDYIWLDYPEAIFCDSGLLYLSHVNPDFPSLFPDLPKTDWQTTAGGIRFERVLPNGIKFGGALDSKDDATVHCELHIHNGGDKPVKNIRLQTCAFLKHAAEFSDRTHKNKFVHNREKGWLVFDEALSEKPTGRFRLGWRGGPPVADLPVIVTLSSEGKRLVAMTWYEDTFSLIHNPQHPCMHADPFFPDLEPGQGHRIAGALMFFDGDLESFTEMFLERTGSQLAKSFSISSSDLPFVSGNSFRMKTNPMTQIVE